MLLAEHGQLIFLNLAPLITPGGTTDFACKL